MTGSAKATYDGINAFSETDFNDDLKTAHGARAGDARRCDQIVPYADPAPLSAKLVKNGTLKTCKIFPHGMPATNAETINNDLLAFLRSAVAAKSAA